MTVLVEHRIVVTIPVYNEDRFIKETLESVARQTFSDFKVLISDNASSDGTGEICREFCRGDSRFVYFRQETNIGATKNFKFCLDNTSSEYFMWLGGHDAIHPEYLAEAVRRLDENTSASLVYSHTRWVDDFGQTLQITNGGNYVFQEPLTGSQRYLSLLCSLDRCEAINQLVRRRFLDLHNFPAVVSSDLVWLCHIAGHGPFLRIERPLYYRREIAKRKSTVMERIAGHSATAPSHEDLAWFFMEDIQAHKNLSQQEKLWLIPQVIKWMDQRFAVLAPPPAVTSAATPANAARPATAKGPVFSVVMPAYNREAYIEEAISSVLTQEFTDFEIIVVDDGSTDRTVHIVSSIKDPRLTLARNPHLGAPAARNTGIDKARGEFILWLDSDDRLAPNALSRISETIKATPDADIYYGDLLIFDDRNPDKTSRTDYPDFYPVPSLLPTLIKANCLPNPGTAVRRSLFDRYGKFDEKFTRCHDYQMWTRLADSARFKKVNTIVCHWRQHGETLSNKGSRSFESKVIQDMFARYPLPRLFPDLIDNRQGRQQAKLRLSKILEFWQDLEASQDFARQAYAPEEDQNNANPGNRSALLPRGATSSDAGQDLISVILPTKDRPHLLAQALQSLQYQTYRNFEAVVVNDGGCEIGNLIDFWSKHFDITYARHPHPLGAAAARNTALGLARGSIIAYLDDDDYFLAHHLETVAQALEDSTADFVYTDAEYAVFTLQDGKPVEKSRARPYQAKPYSRDELLVANYIPTPTWAHRASLLRKTGNFDESMRIFEDWDFLIRASAVSPFRKVERQTVEVRQAHFRSDHTLPAPSQQLPGVKQLYERYPAPNSSVAQLRERFLRGLESPTGPEALEPLSSFEEGYDLWVSKHSLEQIHAQLHAERMVRWPERPRFVMLIPAQRKDLESLAKTIDSMQQQLYQEWQLIFIADFDAPSDIFEQSEILGWLRLDDLKDEQQLVDACNGVIEAVPSDWVALLPPGVELEGNTLLTLGDYALLHPEWQAVYTDHDSITATGQRLDPQFKPDFNLDYLRSMDYIGPCVWFRSSALRELGGLNAFPGAWQYDALWRVHDRCGAMAIGHIAEPLLHLPSELADHSLVNAARQVALESHLARHSIPATVLPGLLPDTFHVDYPLASTPLVSIVIPNRDCVWYLQPCIDSLFEKTDYPNFEVVIVDNQTQDPDTLAYYEEIQDRYGNQVRIVAYDHPFNFSAQCNLGAAEGRGEYLLLLNNDTEIIQSSWLSRMVAHGLRPEVGVVGARLVFPESGKVQHAGVVLGLDRLASHGFMHLDMNDNGYMNRLQVEQNYSAVTAACMLVRKSLFEAVGGMDAEHAPVLFNDVDFCLKVREQGQLVVWTPYATLVHHESKSISTDMQELQKRAVAAKRDEATADELHRRWHGWLRDDPAYNRHLALFTNKSFHVEYELVADWDCNFHDRPRILSFPIAGGVGEYRFIAPVKGLANVGRLHPTIVQTKKYHEVRYPSLPELNRLAPDILMQQVDYSPAFREWQAFYRKHRPEMLSIIMIDDLITQMPKDNPNYRIVPRDSRQRLRKVFSQTDRAIVSTEPLVDFVKDMIADVRLVPNTLRDDLWLHLTSERRTGRKARVGWAGAQQHKGDLALIVETVKQTANEVDWIFFGMCPDEIRPYVKEYHQFEVGVEAYPAKLASLNLDLAVAPLEQHPFNEAKSNLRLLEYGVLGLPVVCTDILPYRTNNAPVKRVANETGAWVEAIRERVHDLDATAREGDILKKWVLQNYMLSDHLDTWFNALTDPRK